jgi:hypothetical protein
VNADDAGAGGRDVGDEAELERVLARREQRGGDPDVRPVRGVARKGPPVGDRAGEPAAPEVQDRVARARPPEPYRDAADRAVERRDVEREVVADVVDGAGPPAGKAVGDAGPEQRARRIGGRRLAGQGSADG